MNLNKKMAMLLAALAGLIASPAFAAMDQTDAFYTFYDTVQKWTSGALGTGLAVTMLLMGGAMGVAKNTPMPALSGVAGAAFLHWGPSIITSIMSNGGLF